jgi:hypothetical protein
MDNAAPCRRLPNVFARAPDFVALRENKALDPAHASGPAAHWSFCAMLLILRYFSRRSAPISAGGSARKRGIIFVLPIACANGFW